MSYDLEDTEPYDVHLEKSVTAKKIHICSACKEKILPGHKYTKFFGVYDKQVETVKRCARCQKIFLHLLKRGSKENMFPAQKLDCGETYQDHWGEGPPADIEALAFALYEDFKNSTE